jgi:hypothetical protein
MTQISHYSLSGAYIMLIHITWKGLGKKNEIGTINIESEISWQSESNHIDYLFKQNEHSPGDYSRT